MTELDKKAEAVAGRSRIWDVLWLAGGFVGTLLIDGIILALAGAVQSMVVSLGADGASAGSFFAILVATFGLSQVVWIGPLAALALWFRRTRFAGFGLIFGALIVFLLQAACYGLVLTAFSSL